MKIFVSWSGELSHRTALFLKGWFPSVIQAVELYVSSEDIDKGTRWFIDVGSELETANFGIVCLTSENLNAPWILFESGALSKSLTQSRVTPLLIDLTPADLEGPLVQFQATSISKADMFRLVRTVNSSCEHSISDSQLEKAFDKWWPDLEEFFQKTIEATKGGEKKERRRDQRDILEEVLQLTRTIARTIPRIEPAPKPQRIKVPTKSALELIKDSLENRNKPFLALALEAAQRINIDSDELHIEFSPDRKFMRDNLAKPENAKLLREACKEVLGREVGLRFSLKDSNEYSEEAEEIKRLREAAERHPAVQELLQSFRGEIVNVRRRDAEEPDSDTGRS